MSKELPFLVYCVEEYKRHKGLSGKEVMDIFCRYAVCEYICSFYEALHTEPPQVILQDIEQYIQVRRTA